MMERLNSLKRKPILLTSFILSSLFFTTGCVKTNCPLPTSLNHDVESIIITSSYDSSDLKRNSWSMGSLCANRISFKEANHTWTFLLVWNTAHPKGPFWYLPHDNEESAFDAAVYAAKRYGGGFLAVEANGERLVSGRDPNRSFKKSSRYSKMIYKIIQTYKPVRLPYLALHTNAEGHFKQGGSGNVSMRQHSNHILNFPAGKIITGTQQGLKDEDSLIYLAGAHVQKDKIKKFTALGLNVKFEKVNKRSNDHSMSNTVVLEQTNTNYINIETEHGDIATHKKMIDRVMRVLKQKAL